MPLEALPSSVAPARGTTFRCCSRPGKQVHCDSRIVCPAADRCENCGMGWPTLGDQKKARRWCSVGCAPHGVRHTAAPSNKGRPVHSNAQNFSAPSQHLLVTLAQPAPSPKSVSGVRALAALLIPGSSTSAELFALADSPRLKWERRTPISQNRSPPKKKKPKTESISSRASKLQQASRFEIGQVVSASSRIFGQECYYKGNPELGLDWRRHRCCGTVIGIIEGIMIRVKWDLWTGSDSTRPRCVSKLSQSLAQPSIFLAECASARRLVNAPRREEFSEAAASRGCRGCTRKQEQEAADGISCHQPGGVLRACRQQQRQDGVRHLL